MLRKTYYAYQNIIVIYHLKGPGTISRSYSVNTATYEKLINSIAKDPVYLETILRCFLRPLNHNL